MDHEKSYVFFSQTETSNKRRRVEPSGLDSSWNLREQTYHELWGQQQQRVQDILDAANSTTLDELSGFLEDARRGFVNEQYQTLRRKLPCGLILAGPSIAAHATLFDQLSRQVATENSSIFALITSADSPNLKSLLKVLIRNGTAQKSMDDEDGEFVSRKREGPKLLNYDLQLLHESVTESSVDQVIVAFRDCEAFDANVLSETVELLGLWSDRIPLVLLFGIATSIDNLQDRLTQRATRCMQGRQFDVVQVDEVLEQMLLATVGSEDASLQLGAQLSNMLLSRHREHIQSVQDFTDAFQYAYMAHFYANPLSVFLSCELTFKDLSKDHFEAIRNLPSFRRLMDAYLKDRKKFPVARKLIDSDQAVFDLAIEALPATQATLSGIIGASNLLHVCRSQLFKTQSLLRSTLLIKGLAGQLADSPMLRETLLSLKKASSDTLSGMLTDIEPWLRGKDADTVKVIQKRLQGLLAQNGGKEGPLRSEHDIRSDTFRTTVVAHKVLLTKHKSNLSEKDAAYSKLVNELHDWLQAYFEESLANPQELLMHEVVLYDLRGPHRLAFTPKTRHAVERALFSPHDYLNCSCCLSNHEDPDAEVALAGTQPPTALLYRLYLESGALINVSDLSSAFSAIMEDAGEDDSTKIMSLFQQALAELKSLGLVKSTRKKQDHIAKVAWRGL